MSAPPGLDPPDPKRDYTFVLYKRVKYTFNAGEYDPKTQTPRYSFQMRTQAHVGHMVNVKDYRIQTAGGDLQMWEVDNQSDWPVIVTIKRDGELILLEEPRIRF